MRLYAVSPLRNFWLQVYVGEGQLGGVSVLPFPVPPANNPTVRQGHYEFAYGLPIEVIGRDLSIEADVVKTSPSSKASITAELWETIPARYLGRSSKFDSNHKFHLEHFDTSAAFGADGKAHLSIVIKIV